MLLSHSISLLMTLIVAAQTTPPVSTPDLAGTELQVRAKIESWRDRAIELDDDLSARLDVISIGSDPQDV